MNRIFLRLAGLSAGAFFAGISAGSSAVAQDAVTAPATTVVTPAGAVAPIGDCELHVFPAERFKAQTTSLFSSFGLIGAIADASGHAKGDQARKAAIASALDSPGQSNALGSFDLSAMLGIRPSRIVLHSEPLDRKTINKISTRRSDSASSCYSELMVADLLYMKSPIYGRSLRGLFMVRDFGAARDKPAIYKGWGGNGLKKFPAKEGEDVQAANDELVSVFKADFEEFSRNAVKARKAR